MLEPGTSIGRYTVRRKLAEGGMAELFVAQSIGPEGFSKDVVLKVVRAQLAQDPQFLAMFAAEARLASRLTHANLVQIFDFGRHGDSYYLAMEYVRGGSLWTLCGKSRLLGQAFPHLLAAEIGAQIARGLHSAHGASVQGVPLLLVHRDVTPHNILLSFDGAVKLTDFGIATAATSQTAPGMLKGKFAYMSPEQARGEPVDRRTDVFALGIVLWEMLTGGRLFDAASEVATLRAVQEQPIVPPERLNVEVPAGLSEIVMRALARPCDERYQSAAELDRALSLFVLRNAESPDETDVAAYAQRTLPDEYAALLRSGTLGALPFLETSSPNDPFAPGAAFDPTLRVARTPELGDTRLDRGRTASRTEPLPAAAEGTPFTPERRIDSPPPQRRSPSATDTEPMPRPSVVAARAPPSALDDGAAGSSHANPARTSPAAAAPTAPLAFASDDGAATSSGPLGSEEGPPAARGLAAVSLLGLVLVSATAWTVWERERAQAPKPTTPPPALAAASVAAPPFEPELALPGGDRAAAPPDATPKPVAPSLPALAAIEVRARPYATVYLNERRLAEVEAPQRFPVKAGTWELRLVHPRRTEQHHLILRPGETATIQFDALSPGR
jgi:serine/threonine protein kinase